MKNLFKNIWSKINSPLPKNWENPNLYFTIQVMILTAIGLLFVFDTCYSGKQHNFGMGFKQIAFIILGFIFYFFVGRMDLRKIRSTTVGVALFSLILLCLLPFLGIEINGAKRWLPLFGGINIQPSEIEKLSFVLGLSFLLDITRSFRYKAYKSGRNNYGLFWIIVILLFAGLVLIAQESMSATIIFITVVIVMGIFGNFSRKLLWGVVGVCFVVIFVFTMVGVSEYYKENPNEETLEDVQLIKAEKLDMALTLVEQNIELTSEQEELVNNYLIFNKLIDKKEIKKIKNETAEKKEENTNKLVGFIKGENDFRIKRIIAWINPQKYIYQEGLQPANSLVAISSGGVFGRGLGKGNCKFKIPESHNDYIFPNIIEECGFVGGLILLGIFAWMFYTVFNIISVCKNDYGKFLAFGCLAMLGAELFINLFVALNMIPSTGVCLPFISAGGTATIVSYILGGIVVAVSRQINVPGNVISEDVVVMTKRGKKYEPKTLK